MAWHEEASGLRTRFVMNIIWLQLQVCKHNSIFVHFNLAGNTDSIPQTAVEFNAAISADQQIPLEYNKAYITNSANHQLPLEFNQATTPTPVDQIPLEYNEAYTTNLANQQFQLEYKAYTTNSDEHNDLEYYVNADDSEYETVDN